MWLSCGLLAGCLELEQTVTLQPDGAGVQTVRMAAREQLLAELRRAAPAARLGPASDPTAVFDAALVGRELQAAGLVLTSHDVTTADGTRRVELAASFRDFATLRKSPLCGSAAEWELGPGPRAGTARLTLYPQGRQAWQEARVRAEAMQDEPDPVAADFFAKRREQLAGLDVVVRFRVPGDVLVWTANMEKTGDREVTARVTAEEIATPRDLVRRLAPRFEVIFDARGCSFLD